MGRFCIYIVDQHSESLFPFFTNIQQERTENEWCKGVAGCRSKMFWIFSQLLVFLVLDDAFLDVMHEETNPDSPLSVWPCGYRMADMVSMLLLEAYWILVDGDVVDYNFKTTQRLRLRLSGNFQNFDFVPYK